MKQYCTILYDIIKRKKRIEVRVKNLKRNVSLTLDHDVVEGIKVLAEESDRSFSQYVNMVLKRILKNKAEREEKEE